MKKKNQKKKSCGEEGKQKEIQGSISMSSSSSSSLNPPFILKTLIVATIIIIIFFVSTSPPHTQAFSQSVVERRGRGTRSLLSFKETPGGGNATFDCSPSGPCVPCLYSEKGDAKYRCSETGYRIPLKCVELGDGSKVKKDKKTTNKGRATLEISSGHAKAQEVVLDVEELNTPLKHRRLLDDSATLEDGRHAYVTYRSCIPAENEEKLSVLGFEGIMFVLVLTTGSFIYYRRKQAVAMSGGAPMRIQTNSRF